MNFANLLKSNASLFMIVFIAILLVSSSAILSHDDAGALKKKEKKALKQINKLIIRATEGQPSKVDLLIISEKNDSTIQVLLNKTGNVTMPIPIPPEPQPPTNETTPPTNQTLPPCEAGFELDKDNICVPISNPPPIQCGPNEHVEDEVCVPNPQPPIGGNATKTKLCLVGDLDNDLVPNAMTEAKCNFKVGLGDLGYSSTLKWFKSLNFNACVIGNHDAVEDGSASLYNETLAYCKDHWFKIIANDTTIIIGLNTNGDMKTQLDFVKSIPVNNYKNVIIVSHKGGHVFNSAHHPAEAMALYAAIEQIPFEGKLWEIAGHNHNMASADNNGWFISGAGGRSHYSCGTDSNWKFCDASHYGFLQMDIHNSNGDVKANFIDTNGKTIH